MSNKHCCNCYYGDRCAAEHACEHFTPMDDDAEQSVVDDEIEESRREFRAEWLQYITNNEF